MAAEVLDDVEHSGHLTEDQDFVLPFDEGRQHLIEDLHLAADLDEVVVDAVVDAVLRQRILDEVGVIGDLAEVHHPALDGEVEVSVSLKLVQLVAVGARHRGQPLLAILVKLRNLKWRRKLATEANPSTASGGRWLVT